VDPVHPGVDQDQLAVVEPDQAGRDRDVDPLAVGYPGRDDLVIAAASAQRQYEQLH
jgi:hypothetical protein